MCSNIKSCQPPSLAEYGVSSVQFQGLRMYVIIINLVSYYH